MFVRLQNFVKNFFFEESSLPENIVSNVWRIINYDKNKKIPVK